MKKIIRDVDEARGIVQVTIVDERWYLKPVKGAEGMPEIKAVPSVTWIAGKYPKGVPFYKWLAERGWDEAEAIKEAAGSKGSKIHAAIVDVLLGNPVRMDSKYINPKTDQLEELTLEECDAILSFVRWFVENKPEVIAYERPVFHDKLNYAGTIDFICKLGEKYWIVDFKTGQHVWPEYKLQLSAYKRAVADGYLSEVPALKGILAEQLNLAVLQVGYRMNKAGYKWNEIKDSFGLFMAAREIWEEEHGGEKPSKKDYPVVLYAGAVAVDAKGQAQQQLPLANTKPAKPLKEEPIVGLSEVGDNE